MNYPHKHDDPNHLTGSEKDELRKKFGHNALTGRVHSFLKSTHDIRHGKVSLNELDKGRTGPRPTDMMWNETKKKYTRGGKSFFKSIARHKREEMAEKMKQKIRDTTKPKDRAMIGKIYGG